MRCNGASHCEFNRKSIETETTTRSEFSNGGRAIVEQILASEVEIQKSKIVKVTIRDSGRKANDLSKVT